MSLGVAPQIHPSIHPPPSPLLRPIVGGCVAAEPIRPGHRGQEHCQCSSVPWLQDEGSAAIYGLVPLLPPPRLLSLQGMC